MDNTKTMPATSMPVDPTTPTTPPTELKKDHWLVEVVGGVTLSSTMISALALWFVFTDQLFSSLG